MTTLKAPAPWDEDDAISPRAADFIERRRCAEWSEADQAEFDAWLAESTFHRVAYLRLEAALAYTEHLAEICTFKIGRKPERAAPKRNAKAIGRRIVLPLLAAASIAAAAIWGAPFMASFMQPADRTDSTDIGGRTLLSFADRTQIELNTDTAVRVRMTTAERTVWLEKGEAWFHVAHDAAHPFAVIVGKHRITDLGTEFLVRRDANDVDVTLLNGRANLSTAGLQTATLTPGEEAIATPTALSVTRKSPQDLADELAWRRGVLVFRHTRLADVVREFNRYNATKLVIADPSIADLKIVANVRTDDYASFLHLAQDVFDIRVEHEGNVILLSRASRDETKKAVRTHERASAP